MGTLNPSPASPNSTLPLAATKPPKHNIAPTNLEAAWADFVAIVGKDNVSTTQDDVVAHAGSEWSSHLRKDSEKPFLVVYPTTTEEVSEIMKICHLRRIPVTAYSGGTSWKDTILLLAAESASTLDGWIRSCSSTRRTWTLLSNPPSVGSI